MFCEHVGLSLVYLYESSSFRLVRHVWFYETASRNFFFVVILVIFIVLVIFIILVIFIFIVFQLGLL